jgi:PAS domain S-box-containing protein
MTVNSSTGKTSKSSTKPAQASAKKPRTLKQVQETLKAIQIEYAQVLEHDGHGIRIINRDHSVHLINQTFANMSGVTPEAAKGQKCWEIFSSQVCHTPNCRLRRILEGETFIQTEIERVKPDGKIVPCIVNAAPFNDRNGNIAGIIETFTDITERRLLENQVKETEERYRSLIELGAQAGEAIIMLQDNASGEGIQTFVNDQWPHITGYTEEELLGTSFFDLIDPGDREASVQRHRQKITGTSIPDIFELKIIHKSGAKIPVELTGAFTTYEGKKANVLYIRDVTDLRQAQEKISESEERYRSLFDVVPVAIWESDYSEIKKTIDELIASGICDLRGYFKNRPDEFLRCYQHLKVIGINNASVIGMDGVSKEHVIKNLWGALQKRPNKLDQDMENVLALVAGITKVVYQQECVSFNGRIGWVYAEMLVAPGHEKNWSRVIHSFVDITDRVHAEESLRKQQEHLEEKVTERSLQLVKTGNKLRKLLNTEQRLRHNLQESIEERTEFTRALVHELKTPLTAMISSSELLEGELKRDPELKLARNIRRSAENLNKRISELLDVAKGELGTLKVVREPMDPQTLAVEIVDEMKPVVLKAGQSIHLKAPKSLPRILADKERVKEVILNLISNALKFNRDHGRIILRVSQETDKVVFEVEDEGIGISKSEQVRIFKPYRRINIKGENLSGLGIGLALAKSLVELHNGKIWVKSTRNKGSSFYFSIPVYP